MVPAPRLLFIALIGVVVLGLIRSASLALGIAILWLLGAAILALIDAWFVPGADRLVWSRQHDSKLSLGAWNPVTLTLRNGSDRRIRFRVRDAVPPVLITEQRVNEGSCRPDESWQLTYRVFPIHRGDFSFGPVSARYLGPLGLVWRQRAINLADQVKVYPNLLAVQAYEESSRRGRLEQLGLRRSRRRGAGTEFERLRDYSPDDEFRRINWKATAKRRIPIIVEYETERSQTIVLLLDAGRLMGTYLPDLGDLAMKMFDRDQEVSIRPELTGRPRPLSRLDYSINAALLLAFVSQRQGDRVGLLAFSDRVRRYVAPRTGHRHFLTLTEALYNLESEPTEADYGEAVAYLAAHNPRRALVAVFTEISSADAATELVAHLGYLARRHLPLVVALRDPGIERLATLAVADSESVYRRAVAQTVLDEREAALVRLRQAGVLTLDVSADKLSPSLVNRYFDIKCRGAL